MTTPFTYGDPSKTNSFLRGIIPTIVNNGSVSDKYRNRVYIVGRSKLTASVINSLPNLSYPGLVPASPFSTGVNGLGTDEYLYFHLVYEPMAASNAPPSSSVIPGPPRLAFISLYNVDENFTPIPFTLAISGTRPVTPGTIQPFTLKPVGLDLPSLSYVALESPPVYDTSAYEVSNQPLASIYLASQGTDSITIYEGGVSNPNSIESLSSNPAKLEQQNAYTGVWYKTYSSPSAANLQTPNTSNLWHVFNPFTNPNGTALNTFGLTTSTFQLAPFTGGGQVLPVYTVGDPAPPLNYQQSPTATLIVDSNTPPYTLEQLTAMTADINDVGNVMSNWGLSEMEIMFLPYQATIMLSSPNLGCFVSQPVSSPAQFQNFVTTAYNQSLTYVDPYTGTDVTTTGCTNNTNHGWLNETLLSSGTPIYEFNNCILTNSEQCNTTVSGADGYWYTYCTGTETCGNNNCFGTCVDTTSDRYIPCVRDYAYTHDNTDGTTYWSCHPKQPRPENENGLKGWQIALIVIMSIIIFILIIAIFWYIIKSASDSGGTTTTVTDVVQQQPVYYYPQ